MSRLFDTLSMLASCCGVDGMTISLRILAALVPSAVYTRYARSASSLPWGPRLCASGLDGRVGLYDLRSAFWRAVCYNVLDALNLVVDKHDLALVSSASRICRVDFVWWALVVGVLVATSGVSAGGSRRQSSGVSCFPGCIAG
jgi:hypothetical protein